MRFDPCALVLPALLTLSTATHAATLAPSEDVMTSPFFSGADRVRGYAADNRRVLRVSTDNAFGVTGAETIYLAFDFDPGAYTSPVTAALTMTSTSGGFNADAGPAAPFLVSAHGVSADPFTAITDNTNPGGTTSWNDFLTTHVLEAAPGARTSVTGFGPVTFDVTQLVSAWIDGSQPRHVIALTGRNDTSGNDFLHGFLDASVTPGATFLTVTPVPEPGSWLLLGGGLSLLSWRLGSRLRRSTDD
jgi:hypothetical protein